MAGKLSYTNWVNKAKLIWGNEYDYSESILINLRKPIKILCEKPNHGYFEVVAGNHISIKRKPAGCPKCSKENQILNLTKPFQKFLKQANEIHNSFYEYDESTYKNARQKFKIYCPLHGHFFQTPDSHLRGSKCSECTKLNLQKIKRKEGVQIIKSYLLLNNFKVSLIDKSYISQNDEASFECIKHGKFNRKPVRVLNSKHPCNLCTKDVLGSSQKLTKQDIIDRITLFKGDFTITKITGEGKHAVLEIKCNIKNHPKYIGSMDRLYGRTFICRECARINSISKKDKALLEYHKSTLTKRAERWINKARKFHGNKYDYSQVNYINAFSEITIICKKHGRFKQIPHTHLRAGCRLCADEELKGKYSHNYFESFPEMQSIDATLYYVSIESFNKKLFKIGITTSTVAKRFALAKSNNFRVSVLLAKKVRLYDAFLIEEAILKKMQKHKPEFNKVETKVLRKARMGISEIFNKPLPKILEESLLKLKNIEIYKSN